MEIISDLHIHGRFSRATSKQLNIENLEKYARIKGVNLLGTGDFTHPEWITELKKELKDDGTGILRTKTDFPFVLQTEISLVYSQGDRGRRVHLVILAPNFGVVDQITEYLKSKGRIDYDGRPIFNINSIEFTEKLKGISDKIELIPAHIWTPWFGMLGSKSGFNSVKECFGDQTKHIHALETGLSSDPLMNWRLSQLDKFQIVSSSDLHSFWPWRMGREATVFEFDKLSYDHVLKALRTGDGLKKTIEVDPGYGKYHFDGHRNCNVSLEPRQSKELNNICPSCGKPLTIGVLNRVEELADRKEGYKPAGAKDYLTLMPMSEIISAILGKAISTQTVWKEYYNIMKAGTSEYDVVLNASLEKLKEATNEKIAQALIDNREGKIKVKAGYDGKYGVPLLGEVKKQPQQEFKIKHKQTSLGEF